MPIERATGGANLVDVLDRVLDKGIVIDAWLRVSLVGVDLLTLEARVVVASIETYLRYSEAVAQVGAVSKPAETAIVSATTVDGHRSRPAPQSRRLGEPVAARKR